MKIEGTPLAGVWLVSTDVHRDLRGGFYRAFCDQDLAGIWGSRLIRQINVSHTAEVGALRGLHWQNPPHGEMKAIRCLRGKVWDVAVDLRAGSPTFLQWFGQELSPENGLMLVLGEGYAHGFQVMAPDSELLYLHSHPYTPSAEAGLRYDDPQLKIPWPLPVTTVSQRDLSLPYLEHSWGGIPC